MSSSTSLPATLPERQAKAESYLDRFAPLTMGYQHRQRNPYLRWLKTGPRLEASAMYRFFNYWYPVSRHQPQLLLLIAATFPEWDDRSLIMKNYIEEDGMAELGHHPHYELLEHLIVELGGKLEVDRDAEAQVSEFHRSLIGMTPAQAVAVVAAIEHPALDISDYFQMITRLSGRADLLSVDPYLYIHKDVEPNHIIWTHGNAIDWMEDKEKQRRLGYTKAELVDAFQNAMTFWSEFWQLAFERLGYRSGSDVVGSRGLPLPGTSEGIVN